MNSTVAVCPPVVNLDDGGTYHASPGQRFLWDSWLDVADRAAKYKPILVGNGDLVEGDAKNRSYQVITRNRTNALKIAADVFDVLAKVCSSVYIVRGTAAHVGKSANLDEAVGNDLDAVQAAPGVHSFWYLPLRVEAVPMSIAHHANMGGMAWTSPSAAQKLAAQLLFEAADNNTPAPALVFRSHVHRWCDSYDAHRTRVIFLPAWTLATEYIHRIKPGALAEIGAALVHVDGDKYEVEKLKYKPRGTQWVVVK